jgi:hypothetical protein
LLLRFLKQVEAKKKEAKRKHLVKTKGRMMVAWITVRWKMKLKRRGGHIDTTSHINRG